MAKCSMFHFLLGSGKLSVKLYIHAQDITMTKKAIGGGSVSSLIIGAVLVSDRPIKLHMPTPVALLSIGNILLSEKLAIYDMVNPEAVPNLATKIIHGILL